MTGNYKVNKDGSTGMELLHKADLILCFRQGNMTIFKSRYTHPRDGLTLMDVIKTLAIMLNPHTGIDVFDDFVKEEIEESVKKILRNHEIGGGHAGKLQRFHGVSK